MSGNDLARYRKAYPRLFRHPGFKSLSPLERLLTMYLLFGPQSNRIGLFFFSVHTAADDLNTTAETLRKGLGNVATTFGWHFDADAKVFFIPSWWKWNPVENVNVMAGALKDLAEVPSSALIDAFAENTRDLPTEPGKDGRNVLQTFVEGLRQRLPRDSGTQYQYQEQKKEQKQKQEPRASREGKSAYREKHDPDSHNEPSSEGSGSLEAIARETVRDYLNLEIDDLVDHFNAVAQFKGIKHPVPRNFALQALNIAIRRVS